MKKMKVPLLMIVLGSTPFFSYADLSISSDNQQGFINSNNSNSDNGNGVVLFDKTHSGSSLITRPDNSSPTPVNPYNEEADSSATNSVEISSGSGTTSEYSSGEGDSSDLSPAEIQSIESQGGTVVQGSSKPKSLITKGYGSSVMKGVPVGMPYSTFFADLDKQIQIAKVTPISATSSAGMPTLRPGATGSNVAVLSQALISKGYLKLDGVETPKVYDEDISAAVRLAQGDLGLTQDGIAGPKFYSALGVSRNKITAEELEAWKNQLIKLMDIARSEGSDKVIIVNIPSYTLKAIDLTNGNIQVESKVIVGKPIHQTPVYRMNMIGLKYNPNWTPPMSVVKRDVLPNMSQGNRYIASHSLKAIDSKGNAYSLSGVSRDDILRGRYTVQQAPGMSNSLGVLKFETDSPDNIYLHDTNQRYLFAKNDRSFSLGCVRVQDWPRLAEFVSGLTIPQIQSNLDKGKTYIQRINKTPIFVTYSLVDVVKGKADKFQDIYNQGSSVDNY